MANTTTISLKLEDKDLKQKLKEIDQQYEETKKHWIANTDLMANTQAELVVAISKTQKAQKNLTAEKLKGVNADKVKIKKLNALIQARKFNEKAIKTNIISISKANRATKDSIKQLKIEKNELLSNNKVHDKVSKSIDNHSKATYNLINNTIRHLRWVGTITGAYYGLVKVWNLTLGKGIQINKMMQDNKFGIASLLSANSKMILSNGQVVNSYDKFIIGQQVAKKAMLQLKDASVKTYATFPQLTEIFQQAIGQTLAMGTSFGTTTDSVIANTVKLSQRMSNIAGAIGMPMDRVREEIRSLLSGNASTDSLISTMIFGSPSEANKAIALAKQRGANGVTELMNNMLKPFDALENTKGYTKSLLALENAWDTITMKMSANIFDDLTTAFDEMTLHFNNNSEAIIQDFSNLYDNLKSLVGVINDNKSALLGLYGVIKKSPVAIFTSLLGFAKDARDDVIEKARLGSKLVEIYDKFNAKADLSKVKIIDLKTAESDILKIKKLLIKNDNLSYQARVQHVKQSLAMLKNIRDELKSRDKLKEKAEAKLKVGKKFAKLLLKEQIDTKFLSKLHKETLQHREKELKLKEKLLKIDKQLTGLHKAKLTSTPEQAKSIQTSIDNANKDKVRVQQELNKEITRKETIKIKAKSKLGKLELTLASKKAKLNNEEYSKRKDIELSLKTANDILQLYIKNGMSNNDILTQEIKLIDEKLKLNKFISDNRKLADTSNIRTGISKAKDIKGGLKSNSSLSDIEEAKVNILDIADNIYEELNNKNADYVTTFEENINDMLDNIDVKFKDIGSFTIKANISGVDQARKDIVDITKDMKKSNKLQEEGAISNEQNITNQVNGYSNLAGVMANNAKEGSKTQEVLIKTQKALAVVTGVQAILKAWANDFPLNLVTVPATTLAVTSLLSSIGESTSGGGTSVPDYTSTINNANFGSSIQASSGVSLSDYGGSFDDFIKGLDKASERLSDFGSEGSALSNTLEALKTAFDNQIKLLEFNNQERLRYAGTYYANTDVYNRNEAFYRNNITSLEDEIKKTMSEALSGSLDFSLLSENQINNLVGNFDTNLYDIVLSEINDLAIKAKSQGGALTPIDQSRLFDLYTSDIYTRGQDYADAIEIYQDTSDKYSQLIEKDVEKQANILLNVYDNINNFIDGLANDIFKPSVTTSFDEFSQSFSNMVDTINTGVGDIDILSSLAIEDAKGYISSATASATNRRDIEFAKAVVFNKFKDLDVRQNATINDLIDTTVDYLGEDGDIVKWLKTLNDTTNTNFSEFTSSIETAVAYDKIVKTSDKYAGSLSTSNTSNTNGVNLPPSPSYDIIKLEDGSIVQRALQYAPSVGATKDSAVLDRIESLLISQTANGIKQLSTQRAILDESITLNEG